MRLAFKLLVAVYLDAILSSFPMTQTTSPPTMKRILCLHGKSQSGSVLSNKIAGARRKLSRVYELDFLDAPIEEDADGQQLAWWLRDEKGQDILVENAFEYVLKQTEGKQYDALLGFSQGGLLATALVFTGKFHHVKAVVTAGAPYVPAPFQVAKHLAQNDDSIIAMGKEIPKLHFAGETDIMIPVERVRMLCEEGGNGELVIHDKGHLFPTKAESVNRMMAFLEASLSGET